MYSFFWQMLINHIIYMVFAKFAFQLSMQSFLYYYWIINNFFWWRHKDALLLHRICDVMLKAIKTGRPLVHLIKAWAIVGPHLIEVGMTPHMLLVLLWVVETLDIWLVSLGIVKTTDIWLVLLRVVKIHSYLIDLIGNKNHWYLIGLT
jgi:hypothetical protein